MTVLFGLPGNVLIGCFLRCSFRGEAAAAVLRISFATIIEVLKLNFKSLTLKQRQQQRTRKRKDDNTTNECVVVVQMS